MLSLGKDLYCESVALDGQSWLLTAISSVSEYFDIRCLFAQAAADIRFQWFIWSIWIIL